ncbi:30S ribosomal protein S4e, partial [Candidatus Micrarchaeota archaeon CG_4_10_14_0_8_um_filter_60_7]
RWVRKPAPGAHAQKEAMPLLILLRDKLGLAADAREARKALKAGLVLVDGRKVGDDGFSVGLMDLVAIPAEKKEFVVLVKGDKLVLQPIKKTSVKYCKILDKKYYAKGKVQLNLHDGRNHLIEKEEDRFKPGDTLKLTVPEQKMAGFAKLDKGCLCLVCKGRHAGQIGELTEVMERVGSKPSDARIKTPGGEVVTLKDYLIVIDKEFESGEAK